MADVILKSTIDVEYVGHLGDDRRVVEAMLLSTKGLDAAQAAQGAVEGRIGFLMRKRHGGPFEAGALQCRVHAPAKVWWQWVRHRAGWSYSLQSSRYRPLEPVFWLPPRERPMIATAAHRGADPHFRPAEGGEYDMVCAALREGYQWAWEQYEFLLDQGTDPGLACDVLGPGVFFAGLVTCNPRSCMHFLELRTDRPDARRPSKPLWEIAEAARQLEAIFAELWPVTYAAWQQNGRMAP